MKFFMGKMQGFLLVNILILIAWTSAQNQGFYDLSQWSFPSINPWSSYSRQSRRSSSESSIAVPATTAAASEEIWDPVRTTTPKIKPTTLSASVSASPKLTTIASRGTSATSNSAGTTRKSSTAKLTPIATVKATKRPHNRGTTVTLQGSTTQRVPSTQRTPTKSTFKLTSAQIQEVTTPKMEVQEKLDTNRITAYHQQLKEKLKTPNITQNLVPLPAGASAALVKPTKYHYYPHNQHIYLLPECAIQQVCNAVYIRLNFTQPLCACPSRYKDPCSASINSDDQHTTELVTDPNGRRALTLVKTCEPTSEMRECRAPRDWSLLALQNIRTGKSHYLVICRCPDSNILEGPMSHDQPTYASVPGIRVYGMMCVQHNTYNRNRVSRPLRYARSVFDQNSDSDTRPPIPWDKVKELHDTANWDD